MNLSLGLSQLNLCSDFYSNKNQNPKLTSKGSGIRARGNCSYSYSYSYRLRSFTFYSLNWMYDAFYPNKTRKVIPDFINILLTPLALAV
jgi:LAGLIDADG DNA endonuclease family